jgi:hypothetical protein
MHADDPSYSDFVFAAQSIQSLLKLAPWFGFFFPAAHLLQLSTLDNPTAVEYVPDGHPRHSLMVVAPVVLDHRPERHATQEDMLDKFCHWPTTQETQLKSPAWAILPGKQE